MRHHGLRGLDDARARSIADPDWFWAAVVEDLGIHFDRPWSRVRDVTGGYEWAKWFVGSELNVAYNAVTRHAEGPRAGATALVWEGEDGAVRAADYGELASEVARAAGALTELGVRRGDRVALFLPTIPEAVVGLFACFATGAVAVPLFSGFAPAAVAERARDAGATVMVTADAFFRRGRIEVLKPRADQAARACGLERMLVVRRLGIEVDWDPARDVWWDEALDAASPAAPRPMDSEAPLFIAYTSGTTGRPKGCVHVHGGFSVKAAEEFAYQFDVHADDRVLWVSDMGWIVGPWHSTGALTLGATLVLYEGAPDFPAPDRLWRLVTKHRVSILGTSPTLLRSLRAEGDRWLAALDPASLRIFGTTGEPIDPAAYRWLFESVGGGRRPIVNVSGGTEVGCCLLAPHPVEPLRACSVQGPALGIDADVYDEHGAPAAAGTVGELVCRQPWPGMTRGLWRDPERYLATYWSRWPGVWAHGDWVTRGADGQWFVLGRSDDTVKVGGKRVAPAEIEAVLTSHPSVVEAAVIGMPDPTRGERLWCFCVPASGEQATDELRGQLQDLVTQRVGKPFRPSGIGWVDALPKTRTGKLVRQAIRSVALGRDPGDVSGLEDPAALETIRHAR